MISGQNHSIADKPALTTDTKNSFFTYDYAIHP